MAKKNIVMLLHRYKNEKLVFPHYSQPKLDGVRAIWDVKDKVFRTRNNIIIEGIPTLTAYLAGKEIEFNLDGELTHPEVAFNAVSGIIRRKTTQVDHAQQERIQFNIFDVQKEGNYSLRLNWLRKYFYRKNNFLNIVKTTYVYNTYDADSQHEANVAAGYEGTVYRNICGLYKIGRSHNVLKRKDMLVGVGIIVNQIEGTGKYVNKLGAFTVHFTSLGNNPILLNIGSGLTDQERDSFWEFPKIGETLEFKYQELSKNGVPRFPIFINVSGRGFK